jgi:hypothetical protein
MDCEPFATTLATSKDELSQNKKFWRSNHPNRELINENEEPEESVGLEPGMIALYLLVDDEGSVKPIVDDDGKSQFTPKEAARYYRRLTRNSRENLYQFRYGQKELEKFEPSKGCKMGTRKKTYWKKRKTDENKKTKIIK